MSLFQFRVTWNYVYIPLNDNDFYSDDMAPANHTVEKVVRDKNTIVQITVHTKPNQNNPQKSNDSKSAKHFERKPTSRSPRRTKPGRTKSVAVEKEV